MLQPIQACLRDAAARARDTMRVGPFLATFARHSTNPYLNYAFPDEEAVPSADDIAALVDAYRSRGLTPRLEYLPHVAPLVEAALLAHGFIVEKRLPLMVYEPASLPDRPISPGIELLVPATDNDLLAMLMALNEAYGDEPPRPQDVEYRRAFLAAGGLAVLARDVTTGEPAGGGMCDIPIRGLTELFGIGVR